MSKVATTTRMQALIELGQSVWLDYLRRSMLQSGELQRMIDDGLRGMTSNPTIFEHAIGGSTDYDHALSRVAASPRTDREIFELLAVEDVRTAADAFRPVYDASQGADGFRSLEVSPTLAPARQDRDCERATCLRLVPRVAARAAVAVARGGGGEAPALAVGQHRHQGPSLFGCPLRGFADRRGHDKHVTAADAPAVRRPRHRARSPSRRRRGRAPRHG